MTPFAKCGVKHTDVAFSPTHADGEEKQTLFKDKDAAKLGTAGGV